jgi:hypothetical protein
LVNGLPCRLVAATEPGPGRGGAGAPVRPGHRVGRVGSKQSRELSAQIWSLSMTLGCCPFHRMPPKDSIALSTPPTNAERWRSAPTSIRQASTRSCPKRSLPPPSIGFCTMRMLLSPKVIASTSPSHQRPRRQATAVMPRQHATRRPLGPTGPGFCQFNSELVNRLPRACFRDRPPRSMTVITIGWSVPIRASPSAGVDIHGVCGMF